MGSILPFCYFDTLTSNAVAMLWTSNARRNNQEKPIKTRRLVLRALARSDAADMARLAGDWDVARMTARIPYPYSETLAVQWMETLEPGEHVRAVMLDGVLIGAVGYMPQPDGSAEIGYWIGKPWWGQGYATEAARALVHYCFAAAGYNRLTCAHFVDNIASGRVIEKLGFSSFAHISQVWCDARQTEVATRWYELNRPTGVRFWRRRP